MASVTVHRAAGIGLTVAVAKGVYGEKPRELHVTMLNEWIWLLASVNTIDPVLNSKTYAA